MVAKGRLIVIEGVDGSGKETQSEKLAAHLQPGRGAGAAGILSPVRQGLPRPWSAIIWAGISAMIPTPSAPTWPRPFTAADRYASYKEELEPFLAQGGTVIADRYTTSNMVHQAGKIHDDGERRAFLDWLMDYEFNLLGLPRPDRIFFLDIPPVTASLLTADRANKMTGEAEKDIHESNPAYMKESYRNARKLAEDYGWTTVTCVENGILRSIEDIHEEIYRQVREWENGGKISWPAGWRLWRAADRHRFHMPGHKGRGLPWRPGTVTEIPRGGQPPRRGGYHRWSPG